MALPVPASEQRLRGLCHGVTLRDLSTQKKIYYSSTYKVHTGRGSWTTGPSRPRAGYSHGPLYQNFSCQLVSWLFCDCIADPKQPKGLQLEVQLL
jgi:hypothetical protein